MISTRFCFGFKYSDSEYTEDDQVFNYDSTKDQSDEGYFKMNLDSLKSVKDRTNVFNTGYVRIGRRIVHTDSFDQIVPQTNIGKICRIFLNIKFGIVE